MQLFLKCLTRDSNAGFPFGKLAKTSIQPRGVKRISQTIRQKCGIFFFFFFTYQIYAEERQQNSVVNQPKPKPTGCRFQDKPTAALLVINELGQGNVSEFPLATTPYTQ